MQGEVSKAAVIRIGVVDHQIAVSAMGLPLIMYVFVTQRQPVQQHWSDHTLRSMLPYRLTYQQIATPRDRHRNRNKEGRAIGPIHSEHPSRWTIPYFQGTESYGITPIMTHLLYIRSRESKKVTPALQLPPNNHWTRVASPARQKFHSKSWWR